MRGPGVLPDQYFLNYDAIIPYLVSAVQELTLQNRLLNARLETRATDMSRSPVNSGSGPGAMHTVAYRAPNAASSTTPSMAQPTVANRLATSQAEVSELVPKLFTALEAQQAEINKLQSEVQSLKAAH